jgi:outer membrane autotransporter protein
LRHNSIVNEGKPSAQRLFLRRRSILTSATALGTVLIGWAASASTAEAACSPSPTPEPEIITCTDPLVSDSTLNALGGDDTINYVSGSSKFLLAGDGDDTINISGGTISGEYGGTITLNIAVDAGNGNDTILITGGSIIYDISSLPPAEQQNARAAVSGGLGSDTIIVDGTTARVGAIRGGNDPAGSPDENTIEVRNGTVDSVIGGFARDVITVTGGTVAVQIWGENGNDEINLLGGFVEAVAGQLGNDVITLNGATIGKFIVGNEGNDSIFLRSGSVGANVHGYAGDDIIELSGATVGGSIFGGEGADVVQLLSGRVNGHVEGGDGNDDIFVGAIGAPGPSVGGVIDGGNGNDDIFMYSGTVGSVAGNSGADVLNLYGGTVTLSGNAVTGGDGDDTINLGGPPIPPPPAPPPNPPLAPLTLAINGTVDGGAGNDTINFMSGSVLALAGGAGNDVFSLDGGTITSTGTALDGGDGDDVITLNGTSLTGTVDGGAGNDIISVKTGSVLALVGGTGNDTFNLDGGTVTSTGTGLDGGDGDDVINLAGTVLSGAVLGGTGNDALTWSSGSLLSFSGGDGSDTAVVNATEYDGTQVLDGGDDTGTADSFIDELTINGKTFSTSGSNLTNWETFILSGGGMTLTDGSLAVGLAPGTGLFLSDGAYLQSGSQLSILGNLSIGPGSRLEQLAGNAHSVSGRLSNAGVIDLQDGAAGDVLAVGGDYVGGGQFLIDIDGDIADIMTIAGNVTGATEIVTRLLGDGTTGAPIEVVRVIGTTETGNFTAGNFDLGAYSYSLELDGNVWQFVPTEISEEGTLYPTVSGLLALFARQTVATHFQRSGSWSRARATGEEVGAGGSLVSGDERSSGNAWLRGIGQWADGEGTLTSGPASVADQRISYERDIRGLQGGVDVVVSELGPGLVTAGLFGQVGRLSSDARNETSGSSAGSAEADAWGIGGKLGFDTAHFYAEAVGGWNLYDVATRANAGVTGDTDGHGYFLSLEAGREFPLTPSVSLVPQAQFAWLGTELDDFTDSSGVKVAYGGDDMAVGRVGLALDTLAGHFEDQPLRLTGIFNYWHEFSDGARTFVDGTPLELDQEKGSIEAGAGFHWGTDDAPLHLHGELTYRETVGGDGEQAWHGTIGARIAF